MKALRLMLFYMMVWLPFSPNSFADYLPVFEGEHTQKNEAVSEQPGEALWYGDSVLNGRFYTKGNIFIDYDYFLANQSRGLIFDQVGKLYFLPEVGEEFATLNFDGYFAEHDISYTTAGPKINYWVGEGSTLDATRFVAGANIYIVSIPTTEVPLPAASWLFASSVGMLVWRRRYSRHCR